jgi:hypothetical protein
LLREFGEDETLKLLSSFRCCRNPDVEDFLTQPSKAIRFEKTANARTYLVIDDATAKILGYFSVSFKELLLEDTVLSKSRIKQLDGISKNAERIRAFLIGQIGKNTGLEKNPVNLLKLLDEVYSVVSAAKALVGGRIIILECEDSPKLIELYERQGFTLIDLADDAESTLRTMYTHISE